VLLVLIPAQREETHTEAILPRVNHTKTGNTKMKTILLIAAASIAFTSIPANAKQEKQVTRTVWELSDFPDLEKKANEVCGGKLAMSDKLKASCQSKTFPGVTKAGAFRNSGTGAELNSLMRQVN
jgi:hypothetical protein